MSKRQPRRSWDFDHEAFWKAIQGRMDASQLSYQETADEIGLPVATFYALQSRKPNTLTLIRVCQWLQTTLDTYVKK